MIGIQAIGSYLPTQRINNKDKLEQYHINESFLKEKSGMLRLAVKEADEETSDLCQQAFQHLQTKSMIQVDEIECIVVCTQNPDAYGLPQTSAIVHAKLGLADNCAAFDISLGCSGFVYGLSIIQGFMQANGFNKGILFTADPYSKIVDKQDKNTSLLFGDGATATLISDTPTWCSGKFLFGTHGKSNTAINVNKQNRQLTMNGRAVFTFCAQVIPENILQMLAANALTIDQVDCFALHQGSRYIVATIKKKLGISDNSKIPFVAADYGNTVSSSIPLLLSDLDNKHQCIVIAGFGVGLSWASSVLFRHKNKD